MAVQGRRTRAPEADPDNGPQQPRRCRAEPRTSEGWWAPITAAPTESRGDRVPNGRHRRSGTPPLADQPTSWPAADDVGHHHGGQFVLRMQDKPHDLAGTRPRTAADQSAPLVLVEPTGSPDTQVAPDARTTQQRASTNKTSTDRPLFAPARKREILDSCRPPDVVVTDGAVGAVSVGVCSPPSRLVTALRTRVAGLTALTAAPRTPVQAGSCPTAPHGRPLHVVVDHLSRIHHFEANVDIRGHLVSARVLARPVVRLGLYQPPARLTVVGGPGGGSGASTSVVGAGP